MSERTEAILSQMTLKEKIDMLAGADFCADLCRVIYGHDSHGAKPGVEMMTAFCAETGLQPGEVTMVGDTMTDLRFARNAGAHSCIGIVDPSYADQRFVEGVDAQVEHVNAIPALLGL